MDAGLSRQLRAVLRLSDEMIALAQEGSQTSNDVDSGILFGILRDCGYKLRSRALKELEKTGMNPSEMAGKDEDEQQEQVASESISEWGEEMTEPTREAEKQVLIVDDEPDVVTYLKTWFEDHGFDTQTASDGLEAMSRLSADVPSLITLDMSMPEQSGVKTYRKIKENPELQNIPVIIITALGSPMKTFLDKTHQVPAPEGFIAKPIELMELASLVKQLVN